MTKQSIKKNNGGGIEGLPLQLMIMVVIAGIGTTIILGWMAGLQPPSSIGSIHSSPGEIVLSDPDGDGIFKGQDLAIEITVLDPSGKGIVGASVILEGAALSSAVEGGTVHGITDTNGKVTFTDLEACLTEGPLGFITVTIVKSGYGTDSEFKIPVICE